MTSAAEPLLDDPEDPPVRAFVSDGESLDVLSRLAIERGWPEGALAQGNLDDAVEHSGATTAPTAIIVDIDGVAEPVAALRGLAEIMPATRIVAFGTPNDVTLYRQIREAGAADYFVKPLASRDVAACLDAPAKVQAAAVPLVKSAGAHARVIAVVGARGGVGSSTVAVNLAWLLAHKHGRRVALVDLDLQFGTCALSLDLLPSHGLREALESPERIDEMLIASAMVKESERLSVLGGEESLDDHPRIKDSALDALMSAIKPNFDTIVIDVPRSVAVTHPDYLSVAHLVMLVTDLTLAGMRDTVRWLDRLRGAAPSAGRWLVANRIGETKEAIAKGEFERSVGEPIKLQLAWEPQALAAANIGRPIATHAKKSKFVASLDSAAPQLASFTPAAAKKSLSLSFGGLKLLPSFKKGKP